MKILMLTPYLPYPPASGGQIRTYNLLKHLSVHHEITLVCLYKHEKEREHAQKLQSFCKAIYLCKRPAKPWQVSTVFKAVFGLLPFLVVRNYSQEAKDKVGALLAAEKFDVIHAETFYVMPHIPDTSTPVVLVDQTLEYRVYKHFISNLPWYLHHPLRIDTFKLKLWEKYYWNKAQLVAAVSEADAQAIHMLAPNIQPVVIPNGASDDMFVLQPPVKTTRIFKILFVGNFSWLQNTEAAHYLTQQVLPSLLKKLRIPFEIVIAGQNIPARFMKESHDHVSYIHLDKADNEMIRQIYTDASVFVAPIFGPGGTRLKILTAMATHLPVITTKTGAEGLHLEDKGSVMLAETPQEFAHCITQIAEDTSRGARMAHAAFVIAKEQFSWESITKKLIHSYVSIIKEGVKKTVSSQ